ncbi:MAG: IclR family transcriptional regulator C-terminal domain-containing protein [Rhodospirillaceae bacterium]
MTETVRSVARSLHLLATLNRNNGASLNWLAKTTGLSRGTTYRMLETFIAEGYAVKDLANRGYWLTDHVRGLSDGYAATGWITTVAKPLLDALGHNVVWPLSLCIPSGTDMVVKMTTDLDTPLTMELISAGLRMPMVTSAAGRTYLAFCPAAERELLLDLIQLASQTASTLSADDVKTLLDTLAEIRRSGYATVEGTHRVSNLSVPVFAGGNIIACIVLRFYTSAKTLSEAVAAYAGPLKNTAKDIGIRYSSEHLPTEPLGAQPS